MRPLLLCLFLPSVLYLNSHFLDCQDIYYFMLVISIYVYVDNNREEGAA